MSNTQKKQSKHKLMVHGGDISQLQKIYPNVTESWIDLSTGINPDPYPWWEVISTEELAHISNILPQDQDYDECLDAFYSYTGANNADDWYIGAGSQALIEFVPAILQPRQVYIISPTYNEHAHCWRKEGHTAHSILFEALNINTLPMGAVLVVTNPNNPDGRLMSPELLGEWAAILQTKGGILVVDEAFIDLAPENSLCSKEDLQPNVIIYRSFGKFFGLAGLRLGFVRIHRDILPAQKQLTGRWQINGLALKVGAKAMLDKEWIEKTFQRIERDSLRLRDLLQTHGFTIVGGTGLYCLTAHSDAQDWFEYFAENGIYIRCFEYNPGWLRFGLPAREKQWQRLENSLKTKAFSE